MGDIAFGNSFGLLENGKMNYALDLLVEGMKPLGMFTPVPWLVCLLKSIPGFGAGFKRFESWCAEQVELRKKVRLLYHDNNISVFFLFSCLMSILHRHWEVLYF